MRPRLLLLLAIFIATDCIAARRDFKGLFGSYRREKYTENEGRDTDFGVDILLATAIPGSTLVKTDATSTSAADIANASIGTNMQSSAFFSGELGVWMSLLYHFQVFANLGYYTYDSRAANPACASSQPCFVLYNMTIVPAIAGVKYRFGRSDIVPYIGAGAGVAYVTRQGTYDNANNLNNQQFSTVLAAQGTVGMEFYISPRIGLRLELSGMYLNLPAFTFSPGITSANPAIKYQANPILVRYSSGLFMLF